MARTNIDNNQSVTSFLAYSTKNLSQDIIPMCFSVVRQDDLPPKQQFAAVDSA
jgi:hypothetical protein